MPVKGICHAFQLEYSLCFLALALIENYNFYSYTENLRIMYLELARIKQQEIVPQENPCWASALNEFKP